MGAVFFYPDYALEFVMRSQISELENDQKSPKHLSWALINWLIENWELEN